MTASEAIKALDELVAKEEAKSPSTEDRERARQIYDGVENLVSKEKAAAWMGEEGASRAKTLMAYMDLYNFANLNILAALRLLCSKLVLRAESQQVDRILDAFAKRWCECNTEHGFKVTGRFSFLLMTVIANNSKMSSIQSAILCYCSTPICILQILSRR
jgi:Sec7-like guanine-nucleotide exchange factor